jgi:hypothetical protein
LNSYTNSVSNISMCGTFIITCVEHGCEIAKETGLCKRGKQGFICLNVGKYQDTIASGRTFCISTNAGCQVVTENVMGCTKIRLQHSLIKQFGIEDMNAVDMHQEYCRKLEAGSRTATGSRTGSRSSFKPMSQGVDWETMSLVDDVEIMSITSSRPRAPLSPDSRTPSWAGAPSNNSVHEQLVYGRRNADSHRDAIKNPIDEVHPNDSISSVSTSKPHKTRSTYSNRSSTTIKESSRGRSRTGSKTTSQYYTKSGVKLVPVYE